MGASQIEGEPDTLPGLNRQARFGAGGPCQVSGCGADEEIGTDRLDQGDSGRQKHILCKRIAGRRRIEHDAHVLRADAERAFRGSVRLASWTSRGCRGMTTSPARKTRSAIGTVEGPGVEVDPRAAEEGGDEGVGRVVVDLLRWPTCCTSPPRMTTIRWPIVIASIWSWVT